MLSRVVIRPNHIFLVMQVPVVWLCVQFYWVFDNPAGLDHPNCYAILTLRRWWEIPLVFGMLVAFVVFGYGCVMLLRWRDQTWGRQPAGGGTYLPVYEPPAQFPEGVQPLLPQEPRLSN